LYLYKLTYGNVACYCHFSNASPYLIASLLFRANIYQVKPVSRSKPELSIVKILLFFCLTYNGENKSSGPFIAPKEEKLAPAPAVAKLDSDKDGVFDDYDKCANTPIFLST